MAKTKTTKAKTNRATKATMIELPRRLFRTGEIVSAERVDEEDDRRVEVAFSSEEPVDRFFGSEVLDHDPKSVRLDWFKGGSAPLLADHNVRQQIGVIEQATIGSDRVGRATVRFGNGQLADEFLRDVRDGIRRNTSVGYRIHHAVREEIEEDQEIFRVDDWEPKEISFVSIPADQTVGVGRDEADLISTRIDEVIQMDPEENEDTVKLPANGNRSDPGATPEEVQAAERKAGKAAATAERTRIAEISALGTAHGMREAADKAIEDGRTIEEFRGIVLDKIGESAPLDNGPGDLDLSPNERQSYSIVRAIHAAASGDWSRAGLERECSVEIGERTGNQPRSFFVPTDVQRAKVEFSNDNIVRALGHLLQTRDLSVGTDSAGGYLAGTDNLGASFIDLLRNTMMTRRMGARVLSGLRGNVSIPRQTGSGAATWVGTEGGAVGESNQTFGQVALSPKVVGTFTDMTRLLLQQSDPSVEALVRADLAIVLALAIDLAAINGSGTSGQPEGILQTTGIGDVAGGTNGLAPTWAHIVNIWREVAIDNADFGSTGWLINAATAAKLATTEKAATTAQFILDKLPGADGMISVAGQRGGVSNQVPSNLTKGSSSGVASALLYGNWGDLLIGEWGILDVLVNPYALTGTGTVRVEVYQTVDIAVRRPQSFAAMQDALTA